MTKRQSTELGLRSSDHFDNSGAIQEQIATLRCVLRTLEVCDANDAVEDVADAALVLRRSIVRLESLRDGIDDVEYSALGTSAGHQVNPERINNLELDHG